MEARLAKVGQWWLMEYGFDTFEFYVYRTTKTKVQIGKNGWLVSSAMWMDRDEFQQRGATFIGQGKLRWWWPALPCINDLICPFTKVA